MCDRILLVRSRVAEFEAIADATYPSANRWRIHALEIKGTPRKGRFPWICAHAALAFKENSGLFSGSAFFSNRRKFHLIHL